MDMTNGRQTFIKENEALIKAGDTWLHFANPHHVIAARRLEELVPALREIEQLIRINNWYAAGFLIYEAASAFDSAVQTHHSLLQFPMFQFSKPKKLYYSDRITKIFEIVDSRLVISQSQFPMSLYPHVILTWN